MSGCTQPRSATARILRELDLKTEFFKEIIGNRHGNFANQIIFSGKKTAQKYCNNIIASYRERIMSIIKENFVLLVNSDIEKR